MKGTELQSDRQFVRLNREANFCLRQDQCTKEGILDQCIVKIATGEGYDQFFTGNSRQVLVACQF